MTTVTADPQSSIPSTFQRLAADRPVLTFLIPAYAAFWTIQFVAYKLNLPFKYASTLSTLFGLALPALAVTALAHGRPGVRDLLRRCLRLRVHPLWYGLALFGLLAGVLLVASTFVRPAPLLTFGTRWPLFFTTFLPEILTAVLLIQIFEEAAWTGFVQHALQERHGLLLASLMVAPLFALGHLLTNFLEQPPHLAVVLVFIQTVIAVFFRFAVTWLYNGSGMSVPIAALFHSAFNSATSSGGMTFTAQLVPQPAASWVGLAVLAIAAVFIVLFTRARLAFARTRVGPVASPDRAFPR